MTCDRSMVFPFTNKTDRHDITVILLKVALNIITLTLVLTSIFAKVVLFYTTDTAGTGVFNVYCFFLCLICLPLHNRKNQRDAVIVNVLASSTVNRD